ncbi:ATP-binding protein [soil metagenome]
MGSVRVRTTLAASLVVGVALVMAALALVVLLGVSLTGDVRDAALGRAETIADELARGDAPDLAADDEFMQVLDPSGAVLLSSQNVTGEQARANLAPGDEVRLDHVPFDEGAFLVVAVRSTSSAAQVTVVVGRTLDEVREATAAAAPLLAVGVPLLSLVVGLVTWWITERALRPVESIRAEVEAISAGALDRRVSEPTTGDEIARLATTMNGMLGRLESSQSRQRRFVSDAAHELRSPVSSIRQHSEVALAHPEGSTAADLAAIVHAENLRVERLVDDLLLLARLDEGARQTREQVDLDDLVLAEAARLRATTSAAVDTTGVAAARVLGNSAELERLVRNLADNASRHADRTVSLSLRETPYGAGLTVDGDGPGIASGDRARVFDRFVRLDDARSRAEGGSGLGLSIVRAVVEAHGGEITVGESSLGGARLEVCLPGAGP